MTQLDFLEQDLLAGVPVPQVSRKIQEPQLSASHTDSMQEPKDHSRGDLEEKSPGAFKTISEAANFLGVPQHVLRFWESRFSQIKPLKLRGGRRYYRPEDIETLSTIKTLLYKQGYTIKGAKKAFSKDHAPVMEAQAPQAKPASNERQKSQLTVIRHELMALKDALKPYLY